MANAFLNKSVFIEILGCIAKWNSPWRRLIKSNKQKKALTIFGPRKKQATVRTFFLDQQYRDNIFLQGENAPINKIFVGELYGNHKALKMLQVKNKQWPVTDQRTQHRRWYSNLKLL